MFFVLDSSAQTVFEMEKGNALFYSLRPALGCAIIVGGKGLGEDLVTGCATIETG